MSTMSGLGAALAVFQQRQGEQEGVKRQEELGRQEIEHAREQAWADIDRLFQQVAIAPATPEMVGAGGHEVRGLLPAPGLVLAVPSSSNSGARLRGLTPAGSPRRAPESLERWEDYAKNSLAAEWQQAAEKGLILAFRGVENRHDQADNRQYEWALLGIAKPRGLEVRLERRQADPHEHNIGHTEQSAFCSWTTDPRRAVRATMRLDGAGGVILVRAFRRDELEASPDAFNEYEVLARLIINAKAYVVGWREAP